MGDSLSFSEVEIQKLFGHEAAEDEDPVRLREYYFKTSTYEAMRADLPLRLLVGHKGIGKSALFQVALGEDAESNEMGILIRPDDVSDLGTDNTEFLKRIHHWKEGLLEIIARKALLSVGMGKDAVSDKIKHTTGVVVDFLYQTLRSLKPVDYSPAKQMVIERFLRDRKATIYIDDLDRGWQGRREDVYRISALLNAVRDIVNENRGIKFRIGLRSDVYYLVRTSDESTDKIEGSVIWQTWTNNEIFVLLVKRIETFFGRKVNGPYLLEKRQHELAQYLDPVIEPRFNGSGHWANAPMYRVLMSLIRKRPRDLVKLCTLGARRAKLHGHKRITTADLEEVFEEYSQGRVQDTVNEFRSELPDIERLLLNMRPSKKEREAKLSYAYATDALLKKIDSVVQTGQFKFANGSIAKARDLAAFMYKINFLTARRDDQDGINRKYFEENRYLSNKFTDFGFDWEMHPAYRWALQPQELGDIFRNLKLSKDD